MSPPPGGRRGRRWARAVAGLLAAALAVIACPSPALAAQATDSDGRGGAGGGLLEELAPGRHGAHPSANYDIGYDPGGWTDLPAKTWGLATDAVFAVNRWLVGVGLWLVGWAYTFDGTAWLGGVAGHLAGLYEQGLVGPLRLRHLALFCAVVYSGWQVLRGRLPRGLAELGLSLVVAAAGGVALSDPAGLLDGGLDVTSRLSGAVLELAVGDTDPGQGAAGGAAGTLAPLTAALHTAFIADPWLLLSFGRMPDGACAVAAEQVVATGPHGGAERPRELLRAAGCHDEADFNAEASSERLAAAVFSLAAAAVTVLLLALVAATVVAAQLVGVLLVAVTPFALVGGILPGGGRQLLWRWLATGLRAAVAVVGMSLLLSVLLVGVAGLLEASAGRPLVERFALLALLAVVILVARRRLLAAGQTAAATWGHRRETAAVGGTHGGGWMAPPAVSGATGFALAQWRAQAAGEARDAARPARAGLAHARHALARHALARRGFSATGDQDSGWAAAGASPSPSRAAAGGLARAAGAASGGWVVSAPRAAARKVVAASAARDAALARIRGAKQRSGDYAGLWARRARHPVEGFREELAAARAAHAERWP